MKKVIDASGYKSDELRLFLASPNNYAVLTDYFGMEAFKRRGLDNVRSAFAPFEGHVDQVLILKPTRTISFLRPRATGLQARLIDEKQTAGFKTFHRTLFHSGNAGAHSLLLAYERKHSRATTMVGDFTRNASLLRGKDGVFAIGSTYPPDLLSTIRAGRALPRDFGEMVVQHILQLAGAEMDRLFPGNKPPLADALYSFPFRFSVAMYCMNLHWTARGDVSTARAHKVSNDATDMTYAAFGSFFDGVITADNKLAEVYAMARGLLRHVFHV